MCTVFTLKDKDHYLARNLDLEYHYKEEICIVPRLYPFSFLASQTHYAMIGSAYIVDGYPLYYDGCNEAGLSMAALSMTYYTHYHKEDENKKNIAVYDLIPWVLSQCRNIEEVKKLLEKTNVVAKSFNEKIKATPLHFMISDEYHSISVEFLKDKMHIYDNNVGVLTNNPPFLMMLSHMHQYMNLTNTIGENKFSNKIDFHIYSNGMGAIGLPGDMSSPSRFIKTLFLKYHSDYKDSVIQCFHILDQVSMIEGSVLTKDNLYEKTIYSCCINTTKQIYYYKTYENFTIHSISLHHENLDQKDLISYPFLYRKEIVCQNPINR